MTTRIILCFFIGLWAGVSIVTLASDNFIGASMFAGMAIGSAYGLIGGILSTKE